MNRNELINHIIEIAKENNYKHLKTQEWCINFEKFVESNRTAINVYWTKKTLSQSGPIFTVQTAISHPTKGKTQLNRRDVTLMQLKDIFKNPRIHTRKGYYQK